MARTFQNNVQIERGIGNDYSASLGFVYAKGYDLPVVNNINLINPVGYLADGRPIYSSVVNANTRLDPRFNHINTVESVGTSTYKAMTLQFSRRAVKGIQFDVHYSYGRGVDNAPASSNLSFMGDDARSDPTNLNRDKGPNIMDVRHNFAGSVVAKPGVNVSNPVLKVLLNENQIGLMLQFSSGLPFTIRSNRNLNQDQSGSDRPLFVGRNSMYLPPSWNVDMRYSRFVPIGGARRAEIIGEFKNVFNIVQWSGVNRVVNVDTSGVPLTPIPTEANGFQPLSRYEQRQFQIGFKFYF